VISKYYFTASSDCIPLPCYQTQEQNVKRNSKVINDGHRDIMAVNLIPTSAQVMEKYQDQSSSYQGNAR